MHIVISNGNAISLSLWLHGFWHWTINKTNDQLSYVTINKTNNYQPSYIHTSLLIVYLFMGSISLQSFNKDGWILEYEQSHSPELGLGPSLICGPQLHPVNLRMLIELIWESCANNLVLVKLHNNLTGRELIFFSVSIGFNMFELRELGVVYATWSWMILRN